MKCHGIRSEIVSWFSKGEVDNKILLFATALIEMLKYVKTSIQTVLPILKYLNLSLMNSSYTINEWVEGLYLYIKKNSSEQLGG